MPFRDRAAAGASPRLARRVVLIAGAGSPIGRGIALRLGREGAIMALVDDDLAAVEQTAEAVHLAGGTACVMGIGAIDQDAAGRLVQQVLSRFGRIDVLIAAADSNPSWLALADKSDECFTEAFRPFNEARWLMQAVLPVMRDGGGGSIVVMGSRFGQFTQPYIADYLAAKEATRSLVLSAAQEWGPHNIRVNLLTAAADTDEFEAYRIRRGAAEVDAALAQVPMPYRGDPESDIGGAALYLSCDESRYLTGEIIHADGGEHLVAPVFEPRLALEG